MTSMSMCVNFGQQPYVDLKAIATYYFAKMDRISLEGG